jgi:pyrrolidone-carboxylate peptidase
VPSNKTVDKAAGRAKGTVDKVAHAVKDAGKSKNAGKSKSRGKAKSGKK